MLLKSRRAALLLAAAGFLGAGGQARAADDDKKICLDSYERAQRLRQDAKLRASAAELLKCSRDVCPLLIRQDCAQWLGEVEQATPSIVFVLKTAGDRDVTDVTISMDDQVLATNAPGAALPVDPGTHVFRFRRPGGEPLEQSYVIREGEKHRRIAITFAAPPASVAPPPSAPLPPAVGRRDELPTKRDLSRPVPWTVFALGGLGLAAGGAFAYFAASGLSDKQKLDACKPFCSSQSIDDAERQFNIADVFLGVGVVSLGAATTLFLLRPTARTATSARVDFTPTLGGGFATLRGSF